MRSTCGALAGKAQRAWKSRGAGWVMLLGCLLVHCDRKAPPGAAPEAFAAPKEPTLARRTSAHEPGHEHQLPLAPAGAAQDSLAGAHQPMAGETQEATGATRVDPTERAESSSRFLYPSGAGTFRPRAPLDDAPRVYAKSRNVWIRGKPDKKSQWIGFLWFGASVKLRETEPVAGFGCATWYAVEPRGYVCVEGERATLDAHDPVVVALTAYAADTEAANPHPFYGESLDAQRYIELPTERTQRAREWDYRKRMEQIARARADGELAESLIGVDLSPAEQDPPVFPELPGNLKMPHRRLIPRSTVAWWRQAQFEGRDWLLTDDLAWVPKDRVRPYAPVEFHGVHLSEQVDLPLAFFRGADRPQYHRRDDGSFEANGEVYRRLSWVKLTERTAEWNDTVYHQTADHVWIAAEDAVIPELRETTPWGAPVRGEDTTEDPPRGRRTWIDVSVLGGWLMAYEGTQPVFVTLMSPGRGGVPHGKIPALETASTPTGRFKITGKFVTSTMIAPNELVHSAVPWAQNFSGPHALHGAYWHNDWGEKKSGGCVNVSPQDGRWLFDWTEPKIPEGWHGVRWLPSREPATTFLVRR